MSEDTVVQTTEAKTQTQEVLTKDEKPNQPVALKGKDINVQDLFLNRAKDTKQPITIYLGKLTITGIIKKFDQFTITLESYGQEQMLYKQGINYIEMKKPKRIFKPRPEGFQAKQAGEHLSHQYNNRQSTEQRPYTPRPKGEFDRKDNTENNFGQDKRNITSQNQRATSYRNTQEQEQSYQKPTHRTTTDTTSYNQRSNQHQQQNDRLQRPNYEQSQTQNTQAQKSTENNTEETKKRVFKVQKPLPNKKD